MSFFDLIGEPGVRLRLRPGHALRRSGDGARRVLESPLGSRPIGPAEAAHDAPDARLAVGAPIAELRDLALRGGDAADAAAYLLRLRILLRWSVLEYVLAGGDGRELAVILPQWEDFEPALAAAPPPAGRPLDAFALLRRADDAWLLESPLAGARFALADLADLEAPLVRRALAGCGLLRAEREEREEPRATALRQWEFHDMLFHVRSRYGWHRDPYGAQFPYVGEIDPLPAARPPWPGERIALARAPEDDREGFVSVLTRRRSERVCDQEQPITLTQFGQLLDRAARIRERMTAPVRDVLGRTAEVELTRRIYPSGGASYELELYPVVDRCDGLESGLYHYDADRHELVRLRERTPDVERVFATARMSTAEVARPQIVLAVAARFARVQWKYRSICYATILRNTGALYQTLYLCATELGLSPCGLGAGDAALFARLTGLDPAVEGSVGDFLLGGRPRRT